MPDANTIIARCAKIAKDEAAKFINEFSANLIAEAITARSAEIKSDPKELVLDRLERDFGFYI